MRRCAWPSPRCEQRLSRAPADCGPVSGRPSSGCNLNKWTAVTHGPTTRSSACRPRMPVTPNHTARGREGPRECGTAPSPSELGDHLDAADCGGMKEVFSKGPEIRGLLAKSRASTVERGFGERAQVASQEGRRAVIRRDHSFYGQILAVPHVLR